MTNYQEASVKLTNTQLKKLKSVAKNKTGTVLKLNKKNFEDEEFLHELFLTIRQTTKIRNAFTNNMSTDMKLSKTQISKIIESGQSFRSWLANLGKKVLRDIAISLARHNLTLLVSNLTSYVVNKFEGKISRKVAVRSGKGFTLFTSNEDMNNIIKIIKSLEELCALIDGVTGTVKHKIKKQVCGFLLTFLTPSAASIVQPVISSVVKSISGTGVRRAGKGYMSKKILALLHPLNNVEFKFVNDGRILEALIKENKNY